jgi:hypothetical protein
MKSYDIIGWIGTFILLLAITLNNFGIITGKSVVFLLLMIVANCCMIVLNKAKNVTQAVVVNVIMIVIAFVPLILILLGRI